MAYSHRLPPGWVRFVATPPKGFAATDVGFVGLTTQRNVITTWDDGSPRQVLCAAKVLALSNYALVADPSPVVQADFTPVWPTASVTFSENGNTYIAQLPAYTDTSAFFDGVLMKERSVVVVPTSANGAHPLVQVVFDVTSTFDGGHRVFVGLTNSKNTVAARVVSCGSLTVTVAGTNLYGPENYTLYSGQYGMHIGYAGGYVESAASPDPAMWIAAGLMPPIESTAISNASYSPETGPEWKMGEFGDMAYNMPLGGGRPELGPIITKAQAEYIVFRGASQRSHVLAQGRLAGSWSGYYRAADGVSCALSADKWRLSYGGMLNGYSGLEGAHLYPLSAMPYLISADRAHVRILQAWSEVCIEAIWDGPANTINRSTYEYDYNKHIGGDTCFLGASYYGEPRGAGRVMRTITDAAVLTPSSDASAKAYFTTVVQQNINRFDAYAALPGGGVFNPPAWQLDSGFGPGGYGSVHYGFTSSSAWQWFEYAVSAVHSIQNGFTSNNAMLTRIAGWWLGLFNAAPSADRDLVGGLYYARTGIHYDGQGFTMASSWAQFASWNWARYGGPVNGDGNDNSGAPGATYYRLEYRYLMLIAKWLGLSGAQTAQDWLENTYGALSDAPTRPHYAFAQWSGAAVISPPGNLLPTATLTAPADGTRVNVGASVTITATAADADGTIASVAFYANSTLLNTDSASPFTYNWTATPAGNYTITAVATDNLGGTGVSTPITLVVAGAPTVALTSPTNGTSYELNTAVTVSATASDSDGIAQVQFFSGSTSIGTDTTSPYSIQWTPATSGSHVLTAVATDTFGAQTTSASRTITVNTPPTCALSAPADGAVITFGSPVTVSATATDSDGTIANVKFYANGALLATDTSSPYSTSWSPATVGTYVLYATSTDNGGAVTTSATRTVTLTSSNIAPVCTLTSPAQGASYVLGAAVTITATATDSDGTIASVKFYANDVLLNTDSSSPFTYSWTPTVAGPYAITAKATDNSGAITISTAKNIVVTAVTEAITVTATILTSSVNDLGQPDASSVTFTPVDTVPAAADVDVLLTFDPVSPRTGGQVTFTVVLHNNESDPVADLTIHIDYPVTRLRVVRASGPFNQVTKIWTPGVNMGANTTLALTLVMDVVDDRVFINGHNNGSGEPS